MKVKYLCSVAGWGNQELEVYQAENIAVADGVLTITALRGANGFTSGRLTSAGKREFAPREGEMLRVEARIQLPQGAGTCMHDPGIVRVLPVLDL